MADRILSVNVECLSCGRRVSVAGEILEKNIAEAPLTLKNIAKAVSSFKCKTCGEKLTRISDQQNRLLFDSQNLSSCAACGDPIPLPRLEAQPDAGLCIACTEAGEIEPVAPPYPHLSGQWAGSAAVSICPRCNSKAVVRQNSRDLSWFIGCSTYPRCHWTTEFPAGYSLRS